MGIFSITADIPFYKVHKVIEQYGYLADPKLMTKYIEFLKSCRFASLTEMLSKSHIGPEIPIDILKEIIRIRHDSPPFAWTASTLPEALVKEKEFIALFKEEYQKAQRDFEALLK